MKAIINWIILIPVLILAAGIELFTALNPEGAQSFFGMDTNGISEIILIAIVALFGLFFILSLFDKKTSPVHILRHNYAAGVCGVIAAFSLAGDTAATVAESFRGTPLGAMDIILVCASALAAIALLLVGINHCTASNTKSNVALLYLSIPLWCGVHLLSRFMSHTAQPVAMAETMDLVMYVCLAIFFMYAMMVVSLINGKNPVKAAIYWGAPASVASVVYALSVVGKVLNTQGASMFDYLDAVTSGFIGLYIISFIAELSFMSKTKDEQFVPELEAEEGEADDQEEAVAPAVEEEVILTDASDEDDAVESEINQNMKKFYDDISSVELEITEPELTAEPESVPAEQEIKPDYGSYFDNNEETEDMYIESENVAVNTTKKRSVDKSKYPVTSEKTTHQHAVRDEYVVGLDEVDGNTGYSSQASDTEDFVISNTGNETAEQMSKAKDSYEARLDEIDRLIISIQGGDADKK
ncbi:MAG: hypothetical protein Q4B92_06525 [Ruminococcus sp.]|nr:hypothetical protein [Ruminococcus sp.]